MRKIIYVLIWTCIHYRGEIESKLRQCKDFLVEPRPELKERSTELQRQSELLADKKASILAAK